MANSILTKINKLKIIVSILLWLGLTACSAIHEGPSAGRQLASTAPEEVTEVVPEANEVAAATFASLNATTFAPKCLGCHSDADPAGGLSVSSLASIQASMNGNNVPAVDPNGDEMASPFYQRVILNAGDAGFMPVAAAQISTEEILAIASWIQAGTPQ